MKNKRGLQKRIMSVLFSTSAVLLLLIFVVVNFILLQEEIRTYREDAEIRLNTLADSLNKNFNSALDKSNNIMQSRFVVDILKEGPKEKMQETMGDYDFIKKLFEVYTEYGENVTNQIKVYPAKEEFPSGQYIFKLRQLQEKPVWERINRMQIYEAVWEHTQEDEISYISLYRKISSFNDTIGYLEMSIPLWHLQNMIQETELKNKEQIIYQNPAGEYLYQNVKEIKEGGLAFTIQLTNGDSIVFRGAWSEILKKYFIYTGALVLLFVILVFGVYAIYKHIISNVTGELQELVDMLREDEGLLRLQVPPETEGGDIDLIKNKFKNLISEINQAHKDIENINKAKKKAEMEYLQMSFNPHLLYNSLSAINWSFYKNGQEDMMNLVSEMTSYYRAVLSGGSNIITIREEIGLIQQYLRIVQTSYNRKITCEVECEESVLNCFVIKQLLQPIVENAVLHGTNKMAEAYIRIQILQGSNDILFKIYNNGRGMSEEEIHRVLNGIQREESRRSYGILNTINRIKTYYGNQYGLDMYNVPEGGIEVAIRIESLDKEKLALRM